MSAWRQPPITPAPSGCAIAAGRSSLPAETIGYVSFVTAATPKWKLPETELPDSLRPGRGCGRVMPRSRLRGARGL
jgi:hypothetical protein